MLPRYREGHIVLTIPPWRLKTGDVVVCRDPRTFQCILKRISECMNDRYEIRGDNERVSTDSRTFGTIEKENILGKVLL